MSRLGKSRGAWERRLLEYARFSAERALQPDLMRGLAGMIHSDFPVFVAILSYDESRSLLGYENAFEQIGADDARVYREHFSQLNPFPAVVAEHGLDDATVRFSDYVPRTDFHRTVYYNEYVRERFGTDYALGMSLRFPGFGRTSVSLYRSEKDGGDFTREEVARMEELRPFLHSAILLRRVWSERVAAVAAGGGVAPRMTLLERSAGPLDRQTDLQAASSADGRSGAACAELPAAPRRPSSPADHGGYIASVLALTPREAEVALAIGDGARYEEIASRFSISRNTVHSHVKSILSKTGLDSSRRLGAIVQQMLK